MKKFLWHYAFALILLLALIARVAAALYLGNTIRGLSGAYDEVSYDLLAQRFVAGYGLTFPFDYYPWIQAGSQQSYYSVTISLFYALVYSIFGYQPLAARLVLAVIGTGVVGLIYLLARRLFGKPAAVVAGIIAAGYAYLVFYSVTLVTETPFIFCLLSALLIAYDLRDRPRLWNMSARPQLKHFKSTWRWFAWGAVLAIAVLLRMAFIFFVPFLLGWVLYHHRQRIILVLIPVAMIILAILPFTIRNYQLWGRFMLLESQFGHVFWNGNHPEQGGDFHPTRVFPIPEEVLGAGGDRNDAVITSTLLRMGIDNVLKDPGHFALHTLTRLREFFTFWPTRESDTTANLMRVFSFGITLPFIIAGLVITRSKWRELIPIYLFILIHTGVYAISWTMIRYRIPLDAILIPFAGVALVKLGKWARQKADFILKSTG